MQCWPECRKWPPIVWQANSSAAGERRSSIYAGQTAPKDRVGIQMNKAEPKVFLTAQWKNLAMLNYEFEPSVLAPFAPAQTEVDVCNGKTFLSVVGFFVPANPDFRNPDPFSSQF